MCPLQWLRLKWSQQHTATRCGASQYLHIPAGRVNVCSPRGSHPAAPTAAKRANPPPAGPVLHRDRERLTWSTHYGARNSPKPEARPQPSAEGRTHGRDTLARYTAVKPNKPQAATGAWTDVTGAALSEDSSTHTRVCAVKLQTGPTYLRCGGTVPRPPVGLTGTGLGRQENVPGHSDVL